MVYFLNLKTVHASLFGRVKILSVTFCLLIKDTEIPQTGRIIVGNCKLHTVVTRHISTSRTHRELRE